MPAWSIVESAANALVDEPSLTVAVSPFDSGDLRQMQQRLRKGGEDGTRRIEPETPPKRLRRAGGRGLYAD